ncbi:MAG: DUF87 domain-containing protein [Lachnospiraceae bacterium]|nr:DUF87 domain-containing protein [Lachnospiraceae bacterium]
MGTEFFTLNKIPDLTLAQYSAEESGGVDEVMRQQRLFYRQLNRKGILFNEIYHLIYLYNPAGNPGSRLSIYFRADSEGEPVCMDEFLLACPISAYFRFEKTDPGKGPVLGYRASLVKQDGMVMSSFPDKNTSFYTVGVWKENEKARLMGLFRMMQKLKKPAAYVVTFKAADLSESMRESFRTQIQYIRNMEKASIGNRDENAQNCLRLYDKFLDSLRSNPHFLCRISAYANNESIAKMLLDSAASEAVEEGSYRIECEKGDFDPLTPDASIKESCIAEAPRGMRMWNSIFLLKEATAFGMFPVLYPGETIEIPKESSPVYEKGGLYLGQDNSGYDVYFPLDLLSKHALIAGVPGSGKTYSMLHLSSQLSGKNINIPILVIEPAKKEYRALARNTDIPELTIFSPGSAGSFPLRINPFEFPIGYKLSEHMTNLFQVFDGAFDLVPPLPIFLQDGIEEVYRDHGWHSYEVNSGKRSYPTVLELFDKIEAILESKGYEADIKNNLITCLQTRIGSLTKRELGDVFNVSESTIRPGEWMRVSCVIELEALGRYAGNFLTLLLLTLIRENLRQNPLFDKNKPRHVIFLEEAHNIIGPSTEKGDDKGGNTKAASTQYIVDMLAEVRALGEAIVIADQLPTALAPQVTKNTSLKIGHRITAMDDRELLASTMSADGVQLERMGSFQPGHALCIYENIQKPFEVQIAEYSFDSTPPMNDELYKLLAVRTVYQTVMHRDLSVMKNRFDIKREKIGEQMRIAREGKENLEYNYLRLESEDNTALAHEKNEKYEEQYLRYVERVMDGWEDLIMEECDYCKTNMLNFADVFDLIIDDYTKMKDALAELMADFSEHLTRIVDNRVIPLQNELAKLPEIINRGNN